MKLQTIKDVLNGTSPFHMIPVDAQCNILQFQIYVHKFQAYFIIFLSKGNQAKKLRCKLIL